MRETANNARPIKTATQDPMNWQAQADFVVIGSGASWQPAKVLSYSKGSKRLAGTTGARGGRYCPSQVAGAMTHLVSMSVRAW